MGESSKKPNKNRGSTDELEALREIIVENQGLYLRVMDAIKKSKKTESLLEKAKRKQKIKKKEKLDQ